TAFMRLSTGGTLLLEASWATHSNFGDDYGIILYGTEGGAEIRVKNYSWGDTLHIYTDIVGMPSEITPHTERGEFHGSVIRQFIETITSGNWSENNGSEGYRRTRVIDACYSSAEQGREIVLDAVEE